MLRAAAAAHPARVRRVARIASPERETVTAAGEFWEPSDAEFPWQVRDRLGVTCGARRTEADVIALAKRLQATSAAAGPYRVVRV